MRRAFTLFELLTVMVLVFLISAALTRAVSKAKARARLSKARSEMFSIAAELRTAKNPETAAARYEKGLVKDPWGNAYHVTVRRTVLSGNGGEGGSSAVWYPNAYSPKGGGW